MYFYLLTTLTTCVNFFNYRLAQDFAHHVEINAVSLMVALETIACSNTHAKTFTRSAIINSLWNGKM